jgi:hypothetical protein
MEAVSSFEISVLTRATLRQNPDDDILQQQQKVYILISYQKGAAPGDGCKVCPSL